MHFQLYWQVQSSDKNSFKLNKQINLIDTLIVATK